MTDRTRDESEIRGLIEEWVRAVARKDARAIASFYCEDGRLLVPNAPAAEGREKVASMWEGLLQLPNLSLTFGPTRVEIAEAGDMAYDLGAYQMSFDGEKGRVEDRGKYVVVWQKRDGRWQAAIDILNSDLPRS